MTEVVLRPHVRYQGRVPSLEESRAMHDDSHERCFMANSVRTEVKCEPIDSASD